MLLCSRLSLFAAILTSGLTHLHAEAPGLESLYPAGGRAGDRIEVKVLGKGLDKNNPVGWCSNSAVTLQPVPLTGDKTKDKALAGLWHITIAKDATPGPCLIRFHNNDGSSPPHIFEVGTLPEFTEVEPNDSVKQSSSSSYSNSSSTPAAPATPSAAKSPVPAVPPSPPFTLNGLFAKEGDADTFPIRVRKGIPLHIELHGYALGSSMDPAMRLLDQRGIELAASHDTHNLDPLIRFTPAADTTIHVQLFAFVHPPQADIAFKGTASHIYRLHAIESERPAASTTSTTPASAPASRPASIPLTTRATLPTPGSESPHLIQAKKGDDLQLTVRAKAIRSPLEAVLRIESISASGEIKVLQTVDDASGLKEAGSFSVLDPALHWRVPADGNYRIVVSDRFQNGSPHHHYELEVKPWQPTVTATLPGHAFVLAPGKTTEIKLAIAYDGKFPEKDKLIARATNLPPGVTCAEVELPTKAGELKLILKAAADAAPAQTPITIEIVPLTPAASTAPKNAPASSSNSSSSSNSNPPASAPPTAPVPPKSAAPITLATYPIPFTELRGDLLIPTDTHPWLTVPATPQAKPADTDKQDSKDKPKS